MQFRKTRSFGPRLSLTEKQVAAVEEFIRARGFEPRVESCETGSAYVEVCERVQEANIVGDLYDTAGDTIAKIRLSGHDEGRRTDSTHNYVGAKAGALKALWVWLGESCAEANSVR
jgi:hypothetical protein